MEITDVGAFHVELPGHEADDHRITAFDVVRVATDAGVTGYGAPRGGADHERVEGPVRERLLGADPRNVAGLVAEGALAGVPAVEHALWDAAGKAADLPVHEMLGHAGDSLPYYLTCVWPGADDQSHLSLADQAEQLARYYDAGHTRFKVRSWRPDPLDDVRMVELAADMVEGDDLEIMLDRTGPAPDWVWSDEEALAVARALEDLGDELAGTWIEEPFGPGDLDRYRRLRAATDVPVTTDLGGAYMVSGDADAAAPRAFRDYLVEGAVDVVHPDCLLAGGIEQTRRVGALAEAFDVECILHGTNGPSLAASLQTAATIPSCRLKEIALVHPPLTPAEMWAPLEAVLPDGPPFALEDGEIALPDGPGLGLDFDESALAAHRV